MSSVQPSGDDLGDLDARLLAELAFLRKKPFGGGTKVDERLAATQTLSALAEQLYGPATKLSDRDQQQRALVRSAASRMEGTGGEALLRLVGLHAETAGIRNVGPRSELAGQYVYPEPRYGGTFQHRPYWEPFLQLAVMAIQQTAQAVPRRRDDDNEAALRDLALPTINRSITDTLVSFLQEPSDPQTQVHAVYGLPGSGRYTLCEQALARVTRQNRHVIRVDEPHVYHRDLLDVLETYGIHAESWSLAACEREFRRLIENAPKSLGGVILRGGKSARQLEHLLPRRPATHLLVTTERYSESPGLRHVFELEAPLLTSEEAVALLASGHQDVEPRDLSLLAELLYHHVGLIAVAARSRLTIATLIRRLRRARAATMIQLASQGGMDLRRRAQQVVRDIGDDADALFALDVALWLTGDDRYQNLHFAVGFLLPGRVSRARVDGALAKFRDACDYAYEWDKSPLVPILRQLRAERMAPLLHALASLETKEADGLNRESGPLALSVSRTQRGEPPILNIDGHETPVTVYYTIGGIFDFAALFHGPDGRPHAQLYKSAYAGQRIREVFEDGEQLPQDILLDPDNDARWPEVTRYMMGLLTRPKEAEIAKLSGVLRIEYHVGPVWGEYRYEILWAGPAQPAKYSEVPRDESVDEESDEIFG